MKAQGLQSPLAWFNEPMLGNSMVPGAGPKGGGGGGGTAEAAVAGDSLTDRQLATYCGTLPKQGGWDRCVQDDNVRPGEAAA